MKKFDYEIIDKNNSPEKYKITKNIISFFNLKFSKTAFLLDDEKYDNLEFYYDWRNRGRYLDLRDNPVLICPNSINALISSKIYDHLIWISSKICDSDNVTFGWILSHELRHFKQNLENKFIFDASHIIKKYYKWKDTPTEIDADFKAYEIVLQLFEKEKINQFFQNNIESKNTDQSTHFINIQKNFILKNNYNVKKETLDILKKIRNDSNEDMGLINDFILKLSV